VCFIHVMQLMLDVLIRVPVNSPQPNFSDKLTVVTIWPWRVSGFMKFMCALWMVSLVSN